MFPSGSLRKPAILPSSRSRGSRPGSKETPTSDKLACQLSQSSTYTAKWFVGWGCGLGLYMQVEFWVSQLQKPWTFLRPFRVKNLFVPLLTSCHVTGLDVRMLDYADPLAARIHVSQSIRITFRHSGYLRLSGFSQMKLDAIGKPTFWNSTQCRLHFPIRQPIFLIIC